MRSGPDQHGEPGLRIFPEMAVSRSFAEASQNSSQFRKMAKSDDDNSDKSIEQIDARNSSRFRSGDFGPRFVKVSRKEEAKNKEAQATMQADGNPYVSSKRIRNQPRLFKHEETPQDSDRSAYQTPPN